MRDKINKPSGTIYLCDVEFITDLQGNRKTIYNLSGIEKLTSLISLDLSDNNITDISALVENGAIGINDSIYLSNNPLNTIATDVCIQTLRSRHAYVIF